MQFTLTLLVVTTAAQPRAVYFITAAAADTAAYAEVITRCPLVVYFTFAFSRYLFDCARIIVIY